MNRNSFKCHNIFLSNELAKFASEKWRGTDDLIEICALKAMSPSSSFGAEFQEQTPVAYFDISSSSEEETSLTGARELHGAEGRALVDQRRIVAKTTSPRNSNQKSSKRARFGSHCALTARSLTSAQLQSASAALAHHDEHAIVRPSPYVNFKILSDSSGCRSVACRLQRPRRRIWMSLHGPQSR
jgi:hypothetical protein